MEVRVVQDPKVCIDLNQQEERRPRSCYVATLPAVCYARRDAP